MDTAHEPALGYMELVQSRDAATLLPIIQARVHPITTICSDEWAAYRRVQQLHVCRHQTANHSLHFVNPQTGVHTQHIESYWSRVKRKFKRMKGVHLHQLPSYLDEFMWRERYGTTAYNALTSILQDIATQYPV